MNEEPVFPVPPDPAETLAMLFAIPKVQIAHDIASAAINLAGNQRDVLEYVALPPESQTAKQTAICYHKKMLVSCGLCQGQYLSEDMRLYYVSQAAVWIAHDACQVADDKGNLAELGRQMDAIRQREGLTEYDEWPADEGPNDYEMLRSDSDSLRRGIEEEVFLTVLERYELGAVKSVYEENRAKFDVMHEVGRRIVCRETTSRDSDIDFDQLMAEEIRSKHGQTALELLQRRLRAAGL